MSELAQKTVILLDHCNVMREPSGIEIEIDTSSSRSSSSSSKNASGYLLPFSFIPPIMKKLWTLAVENTLEYTRIVYDLFSDARPLRFILNEPNSTISLNTWKSEEQTNSFINEAFAVAGPADSDSGSLTTGIKGALKALSQPTQYQCNEKKGFNHKILNKGRIIYITSVVKDEDMESIFEKALLQHNESISSSDHLLQIDECEFIIISIHPSGNEHLAKILPHPRQEISPLLSTHVVIVTPENINETFINLCVAHHDLVSLVVTGIPMKEEQKSQASFNYDVPLIHPRMSSNGPSSQVLRWSSPSGIKTNTDSILHPCNSVVRITPVDVHSRPSTCLSNFVINGRSVALESPKKNKVLTHNHILTSHGDNEMWMHSIETTRNVLEDPPSISEGMGGRVTDYRIPDFVEFMKQNMVVPYEKNFFDKIKEKSNKGAGTDNVNTNSSSNNSSNENDTIILKEILAQPKEAMKERLLKKTKFWPLTISGSVLFPMSAHIEKLLHLLPLDVLSLDDETDCDKNIWALMSIEARGEAPPIPSPHHKKGHKRDEQWRLVYTEVENFIRSHQFSERHKKVLECFLQSRRRDDGKSSTTTTTTKHPYSQNKEFNNGLEINTNIDNNNVNSIQQQKLNNNNNNNTISSNHKTKGNLNFNTNNSNYTMTISDSPLSPDAIPPSVIVPLSESKVHCNKSKTSLASLWYLKNEKPDLRSLPTHIKLYSHLKGDESDKSNSDSIKK